MRKIALFVCISLCFFNLKAQHFTNDSLSRIINNKVIARLSEFETCLKFNSLKKKNEFTSFFHNTQIQIINDVIPDSQLKDKISPLEYINKIQQYYADTGFYMVSLKPYEISEITLEDEYASLSVYVFKIVHSITKSNMIYNDTLDLKIDFIYTFDKQSVQIRHISSNEKRLNYWQIYPQYKGLWKSKSLALDTILINGKIFPVNKYGYVQLNNVNYYQEFLFQPFKRPVFYKTLHYPKFIPIRKNKFDPKDKNITKVNFWKWMAYVDFRNHLVFNGESPIKLASDTFGISIMNNGSFSNFISLNLTRRVSEKGSFSVKLGVGYDIFTYSSYILNNVNTYPAVDPDGDPYLRINRVYNFKERHYLTYFTLPLQIEKGFTFGKNTFFINLAYYFMSSNTARYNQDAKAIYAGYYDYLFNLTIQENGVYDFGSYGFEVRNLPLSINSKARSYGYGIGYSRQINRKMYLDAGLNYRKSIGYLFAENKKNLSDNSKAISSVTNLNHQYIIDFMNFSVGISVKL